MQTQTPTPIPRTMLIRGRRVPLSTSGVLPAFHCPDCGRRHASAAIALACWREQNVR